MKVSRSSLRLELSYGSAIRVLRGALVCAALGVLAACSSGAGSIETASGQTADPATIDFPIFYVKRYADPTKAQASAMDLRMLRFAIPSADLFMRSRAAPSGTETNITARITGTGTKTAGNYDIKDVSASPDGTTILFAMRGPLTAKMKQTAAPSWRIWQYVIATDTLSLVVDPNTDPDPATVNDVSPQFLPDGRVVFSSTRQRQSQAILLDEGKPQFIAQDEAKTEPAFVLHVMNGDGTNIHQISFNQSDDRDPTVLANGRIMWSRWDDAPGKDGMHLYSANPDGTDTQLLYGANSHATGTTADGANNSTIEFVKTHEMQDGRILALVRPYTYANVNDIGGNLIIIDTKNYVENTQSAQAGTSLAGPAQSLATSNPVLTVPGPSPGGRFYSGFPLWDGTGRILVSWTQCRLLTSATSSAPTACTAATLADPASISAPPVYSVWMFDPSANTLQPVMQPVDGVMITDLVAAQPRTLPAEIVDQQPGVSLDQDMANAGVGRDRHPRCLRLRWRRYRRAQYRGRGQSRRDRAEPAPGTLHPPGEAGGHSGSADPEARQRGLRRHQLHARDPGLRAGAAGWLGGHPGARLRLLPDQHSGCHGQADHAGSRRLAAGHPRGDGALQRLSYARRAAAAAARTHRDLAWSGRDLQFGLRRWQCVDSLQQFAVELHHHHRDDRAFDPDDDRADHGGDPQCRQLRRRLPRTACRTCPV